MFQAITSVPWQRVRETHMLSVSRFRAVGHFAAMRACRCVPCSTPWRSRIPESTLVSPGAHSDSIGPASCAAMVDFQGPGGGGRRESWFVTSRGALTFMLRCRLANVLDDRLEDGSAISMSSIDDLESLIMYARSAASLQPDGTRLPTRRCQVRARRSRWDPWMVSFGGESGKCPPPPDMRSAVLGGKVCILQMDRRKRCCIPE